MGRRSFWCNLTEMEKNNIYIDNIIDILNTHNSEQYIETGEDIDICYLFEHTYSDNETIKWIYFSSGGGDWATDEYFELNHNYFHKNLIRLNDFLELDNENSAWDTWKITKDYSYTLR